MNRKPQIPVREKLVALSGALTLAYTAWGFGGVIAWSLHIMLAGGLLTFLLVILPSKRSESEGKSESGRAQSPSKPLVRLLRFPGTYFALAFLCYLAISALNPAWQIVSDERGWWIEEVTPPLAPWLPTSVESPYEPMNAWRIFNMHLAAFSLALGLYLGLSSRRMVQIVLWCFLLNVSLMAAIAIIQKYTQAESVLWLLPSENKFFWGSFFYRNQGAAFLNWGIVIAGTLYFYHARRSREEGQSGGPHFFAFCLIGLIVVSNGLALSRGSILSAGMLLLAFLFLVVADYLYHTLSQFSRNTAWIVVSITFTLSLLLSIGLFQTYRAIDWQAVEERFGDIEATIEDADGDARVLTTKLTWRMAQDSIWTGWGAGSFRYAFPIYQKEIDELFYVRYHRKKGWIGRKFFRYAHNDLLQFLAEYGIIGYSLLLVSVLWFLISGFRFHLSSLWLGMGFTCAAAHAFLDFIFHSPSYWVALIAGVALVSRLLQLEARRG